ncbi:hypothetical protein [Riemerella columbina]|uniref:hypothetical protein n=1 Tax=Riemerella columbina TaxID=103810 RepID=UPI00266F1263|nr:hypothetical protein [Riemerella columbina]WKS95936.1 hypothetical protein NYR17_04165 [Riemerella columbina]
MRKKTRISFLILVIFPIISTAQIKKYTIRQMKDTIAKYNNIFEAYDKLKKGTYSAIGDYVNRRDFPSYDSIRNDVELKKSLLGLLDIKAYKRQRIKEFEDKFRKDISKKNFDSLQFTRNYLKWYVCDECSSKRLKKLTDSIESTPTIFKTVFASAVANRLKIEQEYIMNSNMNFEKKKIVDFLYPTQWEEVRNFVKENWDDIAPTSYRNKILIEMNDREAQQKFEKYFTEALYSGKLNYDDYLFARKLYYNKNLKTKLLLKVLKCPVTYYVDFFEKAEITTQNKDLPLLKEDAFRELTSFPLEEKAFKTQGKPDYNKVIKHFQSIK